MGKFQNLDKTFIYLIIFSNFELGSRQIQWANHLIKFIFLFRFIFTRCHVKIPIIGHTKYIDYLIHIILIVQPICYMLSERLNLLLELYRHRCHVCNFVIFVKYYCIWVIYFFNLFLSNQESRYHYIFGLEEIWMFYNFFINCLCILLLTAKNL